MRKALLRAVLPALLVFCLLALASVWPGPVSREKLRQGVHVYDGENRELSLGLTGENRTVLPLDEVPAAVIDALITTEDVRFYSHHGLDLKRIAGALWTDVRTFSLKEGASTITQQLARNLYLSADKTVERKAREALLALKLEHEFTKDELLEYYLNLVCFGHGAYGIAAAADTYFGKELSALTTAECALLIGLLKGPGAYDPVKHPEKAVARRNTVLANMKKHGRLSEEEYRAACREDVVLAEKERAEDFGYFTDYLLTESARLLKIPLSELTKSGYHIFTTLDTAAQTKMQEIFAREENFFDENVEGAAVLLRVSDGSVAGMIGGREHDGQLLFSRATARRQPGSCLKPLLVYGPALESGRVTCATVLNDTRTDFGGYSPRNFRGVYHGRVTVREALTMSLNVPAVALLLAGGLGECRAFAEKCGITFDENDVTPALALGGMKYGTSPLELSGAYRTLACGGRQTDPWCIREIRDAEGNVLYRHETRETRVMKASTAFLLTDMLCLASRNEGNALKSLDFPVACKTGTVGTGSGGYSDIWCACYTPDHALTVWVGYDKTTKEQYIDEAYTGSTVPCALAGELLSFLSLRGTRAFPVPENVVKVALDRRALKEGQVSLAGESRSTLEEYFEAGTQPRAVSPYGLPPERPLRAVLQKNEMRQTEILVCPSQAFVTYTVLKNGRAIGTLRGEKGQWLTLRDEEGTPDDVYTLLAVNTLSEDLVREFPLS